MPTGYLANVGEEIGGRLGERAGGYLGSGLQKLLGFGDYSVRSNSLTQLIGGTGPPSFANYGKGEATMICHREYIGDLITGPLDTTSTQFSVRSYTINPGNSSLFPWLAVISKNFQFWEPLGMVYELLSESSTYAADMAMGSMFIATNYNSLDAPPTDKLTLLNMEYSTASKPSQSQFHMIECAVSQTVQDKLYIANDGDYKGGDPRFSDLGKTYIGSFGCPKANTKIAEIWLTYQVALYRPLFSSSTQSLVSSSWNMTGITSANILGDGLVTALNSSRLFELTAVTGLPGEQNFTLRLPNKIGRYLFHCSIAIRESAAGTAVMMGVPSATGGAVLLFDFPLNGTNNSSTYASSTKYTATVVNPGWATLTFNVDVASLQAPEITPTVSFVIAYASITSPLAFDAKITSYVRNVV